MCDDATLGRVKHIELLVLQESLAVLNVPLQVGDALVDFAFRLSHRFAHLLSHEGRISRFVLSEYVLQVAKLLEAALKSRVPLRVLVAETLVGTVNHFFEFTIGNGLKRPVQLVVLRVDRSERHTHLQWKASNLRKLNGCE